jgi:hypothetical protein
MNDCLTEATQLVLFSFMGPFSAKVMLLILKSLRGRHYSLIQQTQFIMLSKLLDPLPSNMKDFIRTRVILHSLERANGSMLMFLTHENTETEAVFLSKANSGHNV